MSAATRTPALGTAATAAIVLAALCTFAVDPFGVDRWVFAKELLLVLAAVLAWLGAPAGRTPVWWRWWLGAGLAALVLGAVLSDAPAAQLFGRWPRYEGLVSLGAYALAFAVGARLLGGSATSAGTVRRGRLFLSVFSIGLAATAAVAVLEAIGLRPLPADLLRPGSLLGTASDLGIVGVVALALFLPAVAGAMADRVDRTALLPLLGLASSLVVLAVSASRGALVGAVAVVLAFVVRGLLRRERGRRWWVVLGSTAAAGTALVLALPFTAGRILGVVADSSESATNRLELWSDTVSLVGAHPISGVGAGGFADAITRHLGDGWYAATGIGGWIESPHDVVLQIAAAGGVIGVALVTALVLLCARHGRRHGLSGPFGTSAVIAAGGAAVALCFHFTSPGTTLLLCLLVGATFALPAEATRPPRRIVTFVAVPALVGWAIALSLSVVADHRIGDGMAAVADGDLVGADEAFRAASGLRPWDADIPLTVSETFAAVAERVGASTAVPTAADWASEAVDRLPASTRALKAQAVVAQYAGDLATGTAALERAAELSPSDPQVFHRLGALQFLGGQADAALISLERATALAPDDADIRATLTYVREQTDGRG